MSVKYFLAILGVATLPFLNAFTINVGYPLKVYEIAFSILIIYYIHEATFAFYKNHRDIFLIVLSIWLLSLISFIMGTLHYETVTQINYRFGKEFDLVSRCAYLLFNVFVMFVVYKLTLDRPRLMINSYLCGVLFALIYQFISVFLYIFYGYSLILPGGSDFQFGLVNGIDIPRSGVFGEGNFGGLFFFCSLIVSLFLKNHFFVLVSVLGILFTLSTSALFAAFLLFTLIVFRGNNLKIKSLFSIAILVISVAVVYDSPDLMRKFNLDEPTSSLSMRLNESLTGLNIFSSYPIFGVGLGGYGYHFEHFEWVHQDIFDNIPKRIPNNVMVELLSEIGLFGFIAFSFFWFKWMKIAKVNGTNSLVFLFAAFTIPLALMAYPTFNITYLWFFVGLSIALQDLKSSGSIMREDFL